MAIQEHTQMKVITNNHWHDVVYCYELTDEEQKEFDYIDNIDDARFFRYRGVVYDIDDFERTSIEGWEGIMCESFFSAIVIKFDTDGEKVKVGLALSDS